MSITNLRCVHRRTGKIRHMMDQGVPFLQIISGVDIERRRCIDLRALVVRGCGVQRRKNVDRQNTAIIDRGWCRVLLLMNGRRSFEKGN